MADQDRTVEQKIARIAGRQYGVVTWVQLRRAGISGDEITHRVSTGSLIRQYPGVYRVGHAAPSVEARYLAAVLACGEGALLSGRAAAHLLGLLKGTAPSPEVITPTERKIKGIRTRRSRHIDSKDKTRHRGIPVTSVPRTLVDLSSVLSVDDLARACHEAGVRYRTTPRQVEAVLRRRPTSPGAGKLRKVMRGDVHVTLSKLERDFLSVLREAKLPLPITNRPAGARRVDCRWPEHKLIVELDSYTYHSSRYAWEQDRRRAREARKAKHEFRRYTYGDVTEDPSQMLTELRALLP